MAASNPETQTNPDVVTTSATTTRKPRSWWGTLLSFSVHAAIIALLWSAPSLPINIPEVPPPQSIDATILPPLPVEEEKPVEKPAEQIQTPPTTPTPTPPSGTPQKTPSANNQPAPAPAGSPKGDTAAPTEDNGTQAASGQEDGKNNSKGNSKGDGSGAQPKKLPAGAPVTVSPSGGFSIDYDLDASGSNNASASGGARLVFNRKGDHYVADLSAQASTLFIKAKINGHSEGVVRNNTLATERFSDSIDLPGGKWDKQSSFVVDYTSNKATFTNKGNTFERDLTADVLFDYVSAMAYLQAGFQQGQLRAGQGNISLPIGKRQEIDQANIHIADYEQVSTYNTSGMGIPVRISINSGSIKFIRVWFMQDERFLPLKMEIGVDDKTITLLSRKTG